MYIQLPEKIQNDSSNNGYCLLNTDSVPGAVPCMMYLTSVLRNSLKTVTVLSKFVDEIIQVQRG